MTKAAERLRVAFFGQSGPYSPLALRELLLRAGDRTSRFDVVLVVEGRKNTGRGRPHRWRRPRRSGITGGSLPIGQSLLELTEVAGVPLFQTADVNGARAVAEIATVPFDVLVCAGFDRLFGEGVLGVPQRAALNAHPSALPRLRGPAPIFWALKEGARQLTISIHALDRKEDHGPVFARATVDLPALASGVEIYSIAGRVAGDILGETLERLWNGTARGLPQEHGEATRAPRPCPEDACVIPGEWACWDLVNFSCAAPYFRAPWLKLGGETFHIRRGLKGEPGKQLPGEYVLVGAELLVACRDGVARLEIQV